LDQGRPGIGSAAANPMSRYCQPTRTMKLHLLAAAAIATGLLSTSCLQREDPALSKQVPELEAKVAKLQVEVAGLTTKLTAADAARTTAEVALAKATKDAENALAEATKKSAADLKELAALKTTSQKAEEAHKTQVADLQQQIKAMAFKAAPERPPGTVVEPGLPKPAGGAAIERHISPGR